MEKLEGPWLDCMGAGEPENAATVMRLMLAHMVVLNKRVMSAMVLDRLDIELGLPMSWATAPDAHRDLSTVCTRGSGEHREQVAISMQLANECVALACTGRTGRV